MKGLMSDEICSQALASAGQSLGMGDRINFNPSKNH